MTTLAVEEGPRELERAPRIQTNRAAFNAQHRRAARAAGCVGRRAEIERVEVVVVSQPVVRRRPVKPGNGTHCWCGESFGSVIEFTDDGGIDNTGGNTRLLLLLLLSSSSSLLL